MIRLLKTHQYRFISFSKICLSVKDNSLLTNDIVKFSGDSKMNIKFFGIG